MKGVHDINVENLFLVDDPFSVWEKVSILPP